MSAVSVPTLTGTLRFTHPATHQHTSNRRTGKGATRRTRHDSHAGIDRLCDKS